MFSLEKIAEGRLLFTRQQGSHTILTIVPDDGPAQEVAVPTHKSVVELMMGQFAGEQFYISKVREDKTVVGYAFDIKGKAYAHYRLEPPELILQLIADDEPDGLGFEGH